MKIEEFINSFSEDEIEINNLIFKVKKDDSGNILYYSNNFFWINIVFNPFYKDILCEYSSSITKDYDFSFYCTDDNDEYPDTLEELISNVLLEIKDRLKSYGTTILKSTINVSRLINQKERSNRILLCNDCGWEGSYEDLKTIVDLSDHHLSHDIRYFEVCPQCESDQFLEDKKI